MPFFFPQQQASLAQEQEEMDLFQLLSLLSAASSEEQSQPTPKPQPQPQQQQFFSHCGPRRQHRQTPTFIPAFDILETGSAYELFGEVPGLDIKSLEVRFEDAQTLVLKGLTQRARPTAAPVAAVTEQQPGVVNEKAAEVEVKEDVKGKQASVEDDSEYDSVDTPLSSTATATATVTETPAPAATKPEQANTKSQQAIRAKYWLAERKTGQFARSFSFAQRIEIDDVSAELKEGVLHVIVPKSVKSKKVEVVVV